MGDKPKSLPRVLGGRKSPRGPSAPTKLPSRKEIDAKETAQLDANLRNMRLCPTCKREGRVVSNTLGVNVYCGPCKIHWPIANTPLLPEAPILMPRGISKQTHVEPDWNMAYDDDIGGN